MDKHTILLLFGGKSSEHEVSISSARNIYAACDNQKYEMLLGYIDHDGKWWLLDQWSDNLSSHGGTQLIAALGTKSFVALPGNRVIHPDVILPVLHGKNGEDGTVQGLAALLEVPIVGCDVTSSALCMDKARTKQILEENGIKTSPGLWVTSVELASWKSDQAQMEVAVGSLGDILFVKPSRAGSSVGVSKVTDIADLIPAVERALEHDDLVLVERAIKGRELEVAMLGTPPHHRASGVGEIVSGAEFYDYDDKYSDDSAARVILQADLTPEKIAEIRDIASRAYEVLGCKGLSRVDFLMDGEGSVYLNEVNTFPGFTNISMYPKLWQQEGVDYSQLIDLLIEDAVNNK